MRLTQEEWAGYRQDGYVVRRGVFAPDELDEMAGAGEEVIEQLVAMRTGRRRPAGAYTFEFETASLSIIKWEGDADAVHGIEPFAHLHPLFAQVALDGRLLDPARDILGTDDVALFTEKLNYKRAHHGGPVVLHQDQPYWVGQADDLDRLMTIMLLLDDSTLENGCLYVAPGSHEWGVQERKQIDGFGSLEMDDQRFDLSLLRPVPLAAGDLALFGPLLVHGSEPNRTAADRRAVLYTYQPAGHRHMLENLRPLADRSARR